MTHEADHSFELGGVLRITPYSMLTAVDFRCLFSVLGEGSWGAASKWRSEPRASLSKFELEQE